MKLNTFCNYLGISLETHCVNLHTPIYMYKHARTRTLFKLADTKMLRFLFLRYSQMQMLYDISCSCKYYGFLTPCIRYISTKKKRKHYNYIFEILFGFPIFGQCVEADKQQQTVFLSELTIYEITINNQISKMAVNIFCVLSVS